MRRPLIVLMAAVGCLLTIACTNVAHLSLSRAVDRRHEMAIQVALGAGSGRLLVQLTAEALVIGTVGGALGLALAALFLRSLLALAPVGVPRLEDVTLDRQIAALALGVALVASAVSIIAPAWRSAPGLLAALREGSRSSDGPRTRRARRILLASECAVAIVPLVSAALLVRSFARVVAVDPGYDADHVLTAQVYLPGAQDGKADTTDVVSRLLPRVRALPGVVAAGAGNMAPFGSSRFINAFDVSAPGHPRVTARTHAYAVTPGFADALRLRLRAGRLLQDDDLTSPLRAVVVNEAFASAYLAGLDPVGLSLPDFGRSGDNATVVGVVGTVLPDGVRSSGEPATYAVPRGEDGIRREIHLVVRTAGDPAAIAQALRQLVKDTHAHAVIDNVQPLAALASASVAEQRLAASVLTGLATVALLMAAGGIYGVLSYHVSQRHREIGIRTALGASRGAIVSMVFREGILVALVGIVSGLAMAAWTVRGLESLLFGIEPLDSWSFAAAAAALLSMAAVACILPARHAAGVDPVVALRAE